jgi:streptomycin 6-kinase
MKFNVPAQLVASCARSAERIAWLERLPGVLEDLGRAWSLVLGAPFHGDDVSCSYVVPAERADGTRAILKIGMPHMEGAQEIDGLRFWQGDPTVRLLAADDALNGMLLERCEPGTPLHILPVPDRDVVIAGLLRRLWRMPKAPHPFRSLTAMLDLWGQETLAAKPCWPDPELVRAGLRLFAELPLSAPSEVLLATDLHAGNVLRAEREPWLVIDPKPFIGDPAYDATQHLDVFDRSGRLRADPRRAVRHFADLLEVDHERVRLWLFARAAAQPRDDWSDAGMLEVARSLSP